MTITTSEERLRNMVQVTESVEQWRFWFCTFDDFTPEQVMAVPIYVVAGQEEQRYHLFQHLEVASVNHSPSRFSGSDSVAFTTTILYITNRRCSIRLINVLTMLGDVYP
ncbi:MAG: hypothetical protein R3E39_06410 [Anaerolineae bacterium]